jgi:hypothetical protein
MRKSQSISARAATAAGAPGSRLSRDRWRTLVSAFPHAGDDSHPPLCSRTAALQGRSDLPHRLDLVRPSRPDCISL